MKKITLIIAVVTLAVFTLVLAGCGDVESEEVPATGTCTITIQDVCENQEVELHKGDTVFNVLQVVDVPVATKDTGSGMSIEAINGVATDGTKGWVFYVNGKMPMDYSDKIQVNDGDSIEWKYVDGMK